MAASIPTGGLTSESGNARLSNHTGRYTQGRGVTMRAVLLTGFGGPERLEYRENVPDPVPAPGELRIRVGAAAINNTDIWTREGAYGAADDPSSVAGWRRTPLA